MNQEILNSLKYGEKAVEINGRAITRDKEEIMTVYEVIFYTCKKSVVEHLFRKDEEFKKFEKYIVPFYFTTKEIATEFIESWDLFEIEKLTYWDKEDHRCYGFSVKGDPKNRKVYFVDDYKRKYPDIFEKKYQLEFQGIFGGYCCLDGKYSTWEYELIEFSKILNDIYNLIIEIDETNKTAEHYTYKLEKIK